MGSVRAQIPVADFSTSPATSNGILALCVGDSVLFMDASQSVLPGATYAWTFGAAAVPSSASGPGPHWVTYGTAMANGSAQLLVNNQNGAGPSAHSITVNVTVNPISNLTMTNTGIGFSTSTGAGLTVFRKCASSDSATFQFAVNAPAGWSHIIDWGDGTSEANELDVSAGLIEHTYAIGEFSLSHTVTTAAGCSHQRAYSVFNGSAPTLSLAGAGIAACVPFAYLISIPSSGVPINYTVSFSDGTANNVFTTANDTTVVHTFQSTSCGEQYVIGPGIPPIQNAFSAAVMAENYCSIGGIPTYATVGPFFISEPTGASFSQDLANPVCQNQPITFTNESFPGESATSSGCSDDYSFYWEIPPFAAVVSGALGDNNGAIGTNFDYTAWTSGSNQIEVEFPSEGDFEVLLITSNACGLDTAVQQVVILPLGSVDASLSSQTLCTGESTVPFELTSTVPEYAIQWWLDDFDEVEDLDPAAGSGIGPITLPVWSPINTSNGIGSFTLFAEVGCTNDPPTEVLFTISPQGNIEPSELEVAICSESSPEVELESNLPGANFIWTVDAPATVSGAQPGSGSTLDDMLSNDSSFNATVTYNVSILGVACPGPDVAIEVTVFPELVLPTYSDLQVCPGEWISVAEVDGVEGASWSWDNNETDLGLGGSGQGNIPDFMSGPNATNSPISGTITLTGQVENCPEVETSFEVVLDSEPTATFVVEPNGGVDCVTGNATILPTTDPTNCNLVWSGPGNISGSTNQPLVDQIGTYQVDVQDAGSGCMGTYQVEVAPPVYVQIDDLIVQNVQCYGGDDGQIELTSYPSTNDVQWDWMPNVGNGGSVNGLVAGTYQVEVTNASNCSDAIEIVVGQPNPITVSLIEEIISECGEENGLFKVEANGGVAPYDYKWAGEPNGATLDNIDAGAFDLTIKDDNGCMYDTTLVMDCIPLVPVEPYEFISPNGDGRNDAWVVVHLELYPENEVWIYNRWGQTVHHASPYLNDWGGEYTRGFGNGELLPSATYFFVVDTKKKSQKPFRGIVEVQYEAP